VLNAASVSGLSILDCPEEANKEVSPDKCDELDKMLQEVQSYA
jgi:hypothetical protein